MITIRKNVCKFGYITSLFYYCNRKLIFLARTNLTTGNYQLNEGSQSSESTSIISGTGKKLEPKLSKWCFMRYLGQSKPMMNCSMFLPAQRLFVFHKEKQLPPSTSVDAVSTERAETHMDLSIIFRISVNDIPHLLTFDRDSQGLFTGLLQRLKWKVATLTRGPVSKNNKHKADKKLTIFPEVAVGLKRSESGQLLLTEQLSEQTTNADVFLTGLYNSIFIDDVQYEIVLNQNDVSAVRLLLKAMVGCPLIPSVDVDKKFDKSRLKFHWFVAKAFSSTTATGANETITKSSITVGSNDLTKRKCNISGYVWKGEGAVYYPDVEDVGKRVAVAVDPGEGCIVRAAFSSQPIICLPPEPMIWEQRQHKYCSQFLTENRYRLLSYNVLAGLYLNLKLPQDELYFPYCDKTYQSWEYRYPLLLRELPGYKADIACLQEVDYRLSYRFLGECLKRHGYRMLTRLKGKEVMEGLAIVFKSDRFELISTHDEQLSDLLQMERYPENADLHELVNQCQQSSELVMSRPAYCQVAVLRPTTSSDNERELFFIVSNTHLHFHPEQEHVKVIQAALCARLVKKVEETIVNEQPCACVVTLVFGDFNSTPCSSVFKMLNSGKIKENDPVWQHGSCRESSFRGINLNLSPMKPISGAPLYTNYTLHCDVKGEKVGFQGCLDHIWSNDNVRPLRVLPMPDHSLVCKYGAIPSPICPSDHLPVVVDVSVS